MSAGGVSQDFPANQPQETPKFVHDSHDSLSTNARDQNFQIGLDFPMPKRIFFQEKKKNLRGEKKSQTSRRLTLFQQMQSRYQSIQATDEVATRANQDVLVCAFPKTMSTTLPTLEQAMATQTDIALIHQAT